ncbi:phosphatase PAP2 family protein [Pseudonocardia acaciae]|uniref:phosphatase PAP2 family protein n=1 Tax=Pseudonocardia acaciae TaxID=551276 RepID=UPI0006849C58|nr:phosphatase PAP2 family protein [Pseudonocardia acaciae]
MSEGLLSGRWRAVVVTLAAVSALGAVALGWWYAGHSSAGLLDAALGGPLVEHADGHRSYLWPVADLGSPPALLLGMIALVWAAVRTRRRPALVLAVAGPVLAVTVTEFVLKPLVGRTFEGGGLSLPSGHATSITSLAWVLVLAFVAGGLPRAGWLRATLVGLAAAAVVGVSAAMVALERHYATDTVAGVLVATAVVGAVTVAVDRWFAAPARARP